MTKEAIHAKVQDIFRDIFDDEHKMAMIAFGSLI